ncbi:MAG: hypothetical protein N2654_06040 [Deltaproteobacteria bacterium]|nr:hypothetical protein [Deltaproteobacteria bacterium]
MRIVKGKARVGSKAEKAFLAYFLEKVRLENLNFVSRFRDKGLEEVSLCCSKIFLQRAREDRLRRLISQLDSGRLTLGQFLVASLV